MVACLLVIIDMMYVILFYEYVVQSLTSVFPCGYKCLRKVIQYVAL